MADPDPTPREPDQPGLADTDDVCLCFHVPLGKVKAFIRREDPPVASLISDCLGAGTGCGWCVPVLRMLHRQHESGEPMQVGVDPAAYAGGRRAYRQTGQRPDGIDKSAGSDLPPTS
ncbi:MAG: (2Fe-2S)-binding protein [Phycisphaeraceae bacterium]|nr:(2Fe-2S)-binding protein [Phycisphaeraceae bacterium]